MDFEKRISQINEEIFGFPLPFVRGSCFLRINIPMNFDPQKRWDLWAEFPESEPHIRFLKELVPFFNSPDIPKDVRKCFGCALARQEHIQSTYRHENHLPLDDYQERFIAAQSYGFEFTIEDLFYPFISSVDRNVVEFYLSQGYNLNNVSAEFLEKYLLKITAENWESIEKYCPFDWYRILSETNKSVVDIAVDLIFKESIYETVKEIETFFITYIPKHVLIGYRNAKGLNLLEIFFERVAYRSSNVHQKQLIVVWNFYKEHCPAMLCSSFLTELRFVLDPKRPISKFLDKQFPRHPPKITDDSLFEIMIDSSFRLILDKFPPTQREQLWQQMKELVNTQLATLEASPPVKKTRCKRK